MVLEDISSSLQVAFISTYIPRQCGIATFTNDLANAVAKHMNTTLGVDGRVKIIAMNDNNKYEYPEEVAFEIRDQYVVDYQEAANFLNVAPVDVICLEHEFGIFGGDASSHILGLLENLKKPVITTFHTVLKKPSPIQMEVVKDICKYSSYIVIPAKKGLEFLKNVYEIPPEKLVFIHHGTPDVPFLDPAFYKDQFHMGGRRVILTFGLLGPNKGLENMINALPPIVKSHPETAYIILGVTHSGVKRRDGEKYRIFLQSLVREHGLENNVFFHNIYVSLEELKKYLIMSDLFVTPYLRKEQMCSGTLAYAVACGKVVVSTPYWYAEELLDEGRGVLIPFGDTEEFSKQLIALLDDEEKRNTFRKNAYQFGREMIWNEVGKRYLETFYRAIQEYPQVKETKRVTVPRFSPPKVNFNHLELLTDDTGVLQHATFTIPGRSHGYTTDDNARALQACVMNWGLYKDESILALLQKYLSFLNYAFDKNSGRFRNHMSYNREWFDEKGSEDCHGRALIALGHTIVYPPNENILVLATRMFDAALPACQSFTSPRALARVIVGCSMYNKIFSGASEVRKMCENLTNQLMRLYSENSSEDWGWCEDIVSYDNACIPESLIIAGNWLNNEEMLNQGLRSLEWLLNIQTSEKGHLSLIGNKEWYKRGGERSNFDQQPIDAATLLKACYNAFIVTGDKKWLNGVEKSYDWYLGKNDNNEALYDFSTGGCKDGLTSSGVNQNQGAESTLSWLLALHYLIKLNREERRIKREKKSAE